MILIFTIYFIIPKLFKNKEAIKSTGKKTKILFIS